MTMRSLLICALFVAGCGDGGSAPGTGLPGPFDNGNTGALGAGGTDRGGGGDRGGGSTAALGGGNESSGSPDATPTTCMKNSDCGADGYCNRRESAALGYCILTCELASGLNSGVSAACPSNYLCVRPSQGSVPVCVLTCDSAASCPEVPGLNTLCFAAVQSLPQSFCIWGYSQPS
jgi:hypothetical protein